MSELDKNIELANNYLQKFKDQTLGHFIDGKLELPATAETYENTTPVDQSVLGRVAKGSRSSFC